MSYLSSLSANISNMNQNIVNIADLSRYENNRNFQVHETLTIRASVSIKSSIKGICRRNAFFMDLRDDSGEISAATIDTRVTGKLFPVMEENKTYTISGIRLQNTDAGFTSISHPKMICFEDSTRVAYYGNAAQAEWPLTPLSKIDLGRTKNYFVNIIGVCIEVTATKQYGTKLLRRVTLADAEGGKAVLAVWAKETSLFSNLDLGSYPVVFVKDARIEDVVGLSTTRYLSVLAPDDPRARRVKDAYLEWKLGHNDAFF